jgi:pimeloyl-ACP methyl ester carboxylesterase
MLSDTGKDKDGVGPADIFASARARMAQISAQSPLPRLREDSGVFSSPPMASIVDVDTRTDQEAGVRHELMSPGTLFPLQKQNPVYMSPSHGGGSGKQANKPRPVSIYRINRCKAYAVPFSIFAVSVGLITLGILIVLPSFPHLRDFLHIPEDRHGSLIAAAVFLGVGLLLPMTSLGLCIYCSSPSAKQRQRDNFVADALLEELLSPAALGEHYSVFGKDASKGTIVLLAGASAPRFVMAAFAENLAADGYKVVIPELPGHGSLSSIPFSLSRADRVLCRVLEKEMGLAPSTLLMRASATTAQAIGAAAAGNSGSLNGGAPSSSSSLPFMGGNAAGGGSGGQFITIPLNGRLVTLNARQAASLLMASGPSLGPSAAAPAATGAMSVPFGGSASKKQAGNEAGRPQSILYGTAVTPPTSSSSASSGGGLVANGSGIRATAAMAIAGQPHYHHTSPGTAMAPSSMPRMTMASSIASIPEERSLSGINMRLADGVTGHSGSVGAGAAGDSNNHLARNGSVLSPPPSFPLSSFHSGFDPSYHSGTYLPPAAASAGDGSSGGSSLPRYRNSLGIQLQPPSAAGVGNVLSAALTGNPLSTPQPQTATTTVTLNEASLGGTLPAEIATQLKQAEAKAEDVSQSVTLVSWGASAYAAVHWALRHPEVVAGNVIAAPVPDFSLSWPKKILRSFCCPCCCSGRCCCLGRAFSPSFSPSWMPFVSAYRLKWVAALSNIALKGRVATHPRCPQELKKDILQFDFHLGVLPELRSEITRHRVFISQLRLRASLPVLLLSGRRYAAAIRGLIPAPAAALSRSRNWNLFSSPGGGGASSVNPSSTALLSADTIEDAAGGAGSGGEVGNVGGGGPFSIIESTSHPSYADGPEGFDEEAHVINNSSLETPDPQVRLLRCHGLNNLVLPTLNRQKTRGLTHIIGQFHRGAMQTLVEARKKEAREAAHLANLLIIHNERQMALLQQQQAAQQQAVLRKLSGASSGGGGGERMSTLSSWHGGVSVGGLGSFAVRRQSGGGTSGSAGHATALGSGGVPSSSASSGSALSSGGSSSGGRPSVGGGSGRVLSGEKASRPPQKVSFASTSGTPAQATNNINSSSNNSNNNPPLPGTSLVLGSVLGGDDARGGSMMLFDPEAMSGLPNARAHSQSLLPPEGEEEEQGEGEAEEAEGRAGGSSGEGTTAIASDGGEEERKE